MILAKADITLYAGSVHLICSTGDAGGPIVVTLPDPADAVDSEYTILNVGGPEHHAVTIQPLGVVLPQDGFGITLRSVVLDGEAIFLPTAVVIHPEKFAAIAAL